jgi:UDP:flavonoid glycosyltransferase YjiC (YdhE family)
LARIVLATFGSYGDLHPYLAVAIGLRDAGHHVTIATSEFYRNKIEGEGIAFGPISPDVGQWQLEPEIARRVMDLRRGTEYVVRELIAPHVDRCYEELLAICDHADLIVGHTLAFAVPFVAEKLHIPWLAAVLQPASIFSVLDPPIFPTFPELGAILRPFAPFPHRLMLPGARWLSNQWIAPVHALRQRLGIRNAPRNPLVEPFSPYGNLAWFSSVLAAPQADWPEKTVQTGFPFYDKDAPGASNLEPVLEEFLEGGSPPVVFTLGTSAALHSGAFFPETLEALKELDVRAVLVSPDAEGLPSNEKVLCLRYAPYSRLFSRAQANVHQGGIGTTAQALRAGRPMLVVPYSHDQPDNAARVERIGVGRVLTRRSYRKKAIVKTLRELVRNESITRRAKAAGTAIREEDAIASSRRFIEAALLANSG